MFRVVIGFVAVAFVFAGFRNLPPIENAHAGAAGLVFGGLIVWAFMLGRRSVKVEAVATAVANARAEAAAAAHAGAQSVAQVMVNVNDGARATAAREYGAPEWITGAARFDVEQLEGSDALESVLEEVRDFDRVVEDGQENR